MLADLAGGRVEHVEIREEDLKGIDCFPLFRVVRRDLLDLVALGAEDPLRVVDRIEDLTLRGDQARRGGLVDFGEHGANLSRIAEDAPEAASSGIGDVEAIDVSDDRGRLCSGGDRLAVGPGNVREVDEQPGDTIVESRVLSV